MKNLFPQFESISLKSGKNSYIHQHALEKNNNNKKHGQAPPPCVCVLAQKQAMCVALSYIPGVDEERNRTRKENKNRQEKKLGARKEKVVFPSV